MLRAAACEVRLVLLHVLTHVLGAGVCPRLAQSQERCQTQPHHDEEAAHRSIAALVVSRDRSAWPLTMVYNTSQHPCAYGDMLPLPQPYSTVTRLGSRGCTSVWPQEPITCSSSWHRSSSIPWTPAALLTARPLYRGPPHAHGPRPTPSRLAHIAAPPSTGIQGPLRVPLTALAHLRHACNGTERRAHVPPAMRRHQDASDAICHYHTRGDDQHEHGCRFSNA